MRVVELETKDDSSKTNHNPVARRRGRSAGRSTSTRASTSSIATEIESGSASGYSTPLTSAMDTPVPCTEHSTVAVLSEPHRRRRPAMQAASVMPERTVKAFERARKQREIKAGSSLGDNKRKREMSEDEDDLEETVDAHLARVLQAEEDAKAFSMMSEDEDVTSFTTKKRTVRGFRDIKAKTSYILDSEYESDEMLTEDTGKGKIKVEDSTNAARTSKKARLVIVDSVDEASDFHISDSDELSFLSSRAISELSSETGETSTIFNTHKTQPRQINTGSQRLRRPARKATTYKKTVSKTEILSSREATAESAETSEGYLNLLLDAGREAFEVNDMDITDEDEGEEIEGESLRDRHQRRKQDRRSKKDRKRLESQHPELLTMWEDLKNLPIIKTSRAEQPKNINRELKPFQLEGLSWMQAMEKTDWGGGLLGDEMGMGKTIQAVSLIMSDWPAKSPSLVLVPPVALMQWQQEIGDYTDGTLKTFVYHGTNPKAKGVTVAELKKYDVILMSYNSLESLFRHQEKGRKRKVDGVEKMHFQKSPMHQIHFHRTILDEAHSIKSRTTGVAKACFALKADHKWCLSGTPLQNRIGEFFSLVRFLDIRPFACYFCKQCPCSTLNWSMDADNKCKDCKHSGMQHVSVFNQELLNPIQKYGNDGPGKVAFGKLRLLTDRFMLRRVKRDHSTAMELPAKEINVKRQFFGEVENDFAGSIMNNNVRKFETYVAQGVMLNNYANIFGLIMQMRQVADHPDLILKRNSEGGANTLICCICDETAEDAIRSTCKHDFCRACVKVYQQTLEASGAEVDCPRCHIGLAIDLEQPEIEQDETNVKKSSIINRIKMENWTSSSKIEALVHELHSLRSKKYSSKSIIFSQFSSMLQLVEWRLRRAGITTVMLDGSMTPAQRQASINSFMTNTNIECFLVSLKAGGVALNLTEASKVFIIDPWWNPAAEWQSADRCHRIGQARPCTITRLCIEDSVESRMVLLQEKKANMINSTINSDDSAMESLTPEDMQFLFRGT